MSSAHAVDPFVHEALFYRDAEEYLAGTMPFVLGGLAAGDPVLVAVPEKGIQLVRDRLGDDADEVQFLDMTEAGRNPGRIIPGVHMAFAAGYPDSRVRIVGEPIWGGRSELEYPACVQHEAMINSVFAGRSVSILCPYDMSELGAQVLDDATRTHPVLFDLHRRWDSDHYDDPLRTAETFNIALPPPPPHAEVHEFDVGTLGRTRKIVAAFAAAARLRSERIDDLVLAVNELTTNSVLHARGKGTLRLWRDDAAVVVEVSDRGQIDARRARRAAGNASGYGVVMVHLLCDLVRTHTTPMGTTVRVYLGR